MTDKTPFIDNSSFEGIMEFYTPDGSEIQAHDQGSGVYGIYEKMDNAWIRQGTIRLKSRNKNFTCAFIYHAYEKQNCE